MASGSGVDCGNGSLPAIDFQSLEKEFEEKFKTRYTEEDEEYENNLKKTTSPPPCIHPWYNKPRRNFDYTNKMQNRYNEEGGSSRGRRFHPYRHGRRDRY